MSDRELKTFQAYIFNVVQVSVYLLHSIRFRFFDISRANVHDMLPLIATDEADLVVKLVESISDSRGFYPDSDIYIYNNWFAENSHRG